MASDIPPKPPPPDHPGFYLERMGLGYHQTDVNKIVLLIELHPADASDHHCNQSIPLLYDTPSELEEDLLSMLEGVRRMRS